MSEPLVRIRHLSKVFGEGETRVQAVRDVDLDLARGELVLVMGPSGSGKTTLLSMLGALLRASAGELVVDGTDIAALSERELPPFRARTFGFIFQEFNLVPALSLLRRLAKVEGTSVVIVSHDERLREVADRVLWLEDGRLKTLAALVRDPVCGMLLDPAEAPARLEVDGATLYFCSRGCREQYEEERGKLGTEAVV